MLNLFSRSTQGEQGGGSDFSIRDGQGVRATSLRSSSFARYTTDSLPESYLFIHFFFLDIQLTNYTRPYLSIHRPGV